MPANIRHRETVDAKPMILAIVAAETVIRNAVAVVSAALLPGAVFRLPAMGAIALPGNLLLAYMLRVSLLCRPVLLLTLLLPSLMLLLPLLILLHSSLLLLLLLFCRVVLLPTLLLTLLPLLPLLILPLGLLLLSLLPIGSLLVLFCVPVRLLLLFSRLGLLVLSLLFLRFVLLLLPCIRWNSDSEQQKKRGRTDDSNWFHGVTSIASISAPRHSSFKARRLSGLYFCFECRALNLVCGPVIQRGFARANERVQMHSAATAQRQ